MLYLASKSPRRALLLEQIGLTFGLLDVDVPEVRATGEPAEDYVRRVAREKAGAGLLRVVGAPDALVLGADTEVVLDGEVFGKPRDEDDALAMLRRLAGRTHRVISAVCVASAGREAQVVQVSEVRMAAADETRLRAYVASGEPMGKAGAYAIQGRGGTFVEHLSGSYTSVMGLPVFETARLLRGFGVDV